MFKSKEKMVTDQLKRVYAFGKDANGKNVTEGNTNMKAILGGKGANLAEMANIGLPVPPGFTISCQTCMEYANSNNTWPEGVLDTIQEYRLDLEERIGKKIGDAEDPLLVSVRSGAPMSMPGMMDTVLNLGLNDQSINGLIKQTENPRFAWDSYRRFIQMFSNVVMGLDGDLFENAINLMKRSRGVETDTDLSAEDLQELVAEFKKIFSENVDAAEYPSLVVDGAVQFPQSPDVQLQLAIEAVFGSWNNPRAILYRKQNKIADDLLEAEGWVFSFPIYWYSIPGQTKCIIDNIFSFFVGGKDFKGKKVALISCCQESDMTVFDGAVKPIERGAKLCKWDMVGNVLVPGVDAVGDIAKTDGCAQAAALADKF